MIDEADDKVVELGSVSEDTHGTPFGHNLDGGIGWRPPLP